MHTNTQVHSVVHTHIEANKKAPANMNAFFRDVPDTKMNVTFLMCLTTCAHMQGML